jgi:hypothetical protein
LVSLARIPSGGGPVQDLLHQSPAVAAVLEVEPEGGHVALDRRPSLLEPGGQFAVAESVDELSQRMAAYRR